MYHLFTVTRTRKRQGRRHRHEMGLTCGSKQVFSEPEEEAVSTTDDTLATTPPREEIRVLPDTPKTELKHNPYVESVIGGLQRSQTLVDATHDDDDDDDEARHLCAPVGSRMSMMVGLTQRSRAHSEPDIYKQHGDCPSSTDAVTTPPPLLPGGIHGVRLEPLDLNKLKNNGKKNIFTAVEEDEDKNDAESDKDTINTSPSVDASTPSQEDVTQAPSDSEVDRDMVARALGASACADSGVQNKTDKLKRKLNTSDSGWDDVRFESDPWVLSRLLWTWLEDLEEPVLNESDVDQLSTGTDDPIIAVKKLKKGIKDILECLVTTVLELEPLSTQLEDRVLRRLAMVLTHDRKLPLTTTRASLDRMASTSSGGVEEAAVDERNNSEGEVEGDVTCDDSDSNTSVTSSTSYRLLLFLRQLMRTLSGQNLHKS